MVPTPSNDSRMEPKTLKVRNIVLKPYRYPAISRARLLEADSDAVHVTIRSGNIAQKNMKKMTRSDMFQRSLLRKKQL